MAEILGTLHYLRGICGTNEGPKWRNEMQALIDAETPSGDRRARMIAGFNRGYNGFQQTYRTLHAGRQRRDPPLYRGRLENLQGPDGALRQLGRGSDLGFARLRRCECRIRDDGFILIPAINLS